LVGPLLQRTGARLRLAPAAEQLGWGHLEASPVGGESPALPARASRCRASPGPGRVLCFWPLS